MQNYKFGNGGHAPGHIRNMFLKAIDQFAAWPKGAPEPTVDLQVDYKPRPITLSRACGIVWNCSDILPRGAINTLIDCGLEFNLGTYAAAARAMSAAIKNQLVEPLDLP